MHLRGLLRVLLLFSLPAYLSLPTAWSQGVNSLYQANRYLQQATQELDCLPAPSTAGYSLPFSAVSLSPAPDRLPESLGRVISACEKILRKSGSGSHLRSEDIRKAWALYCRALLHASRLDECLLCTRSWRSLYPGDSLRASTVMLSAFVAKGVPRLGLAYLSSASSSLRLWAEASSSALAGDYDRACSFLDRLYPGEDISVLSYYRFRLYLARQRNVRSEILHFARALRPYSCDPTERTLLALDIRAYGADSVRLYRSSSLSPLSVRYLRWLAYSDRPTLIHARLLLADLAGGLDVCWSRMALSRLADTFSLEETPLELSLVLRLLHSSLPDRYPALPAWVDALSSQYQSLKVIQDYRQAEEYRRLSPSDRSRLLALLTGSAASSSFVPSGSFKSSLQGREGFFERWGAVENTDFWALSPLGAPSISHARPDTLVRVSLLPSLTRADLLTPSKTEDQYRSALWRVARSWYLHPSLHVVARHCLTILADDFGGTDEGRQARELLHARE